MRIAVTGTHGSGKTTLIEDFVAAHPQYTQVPEPYWELVEAGAVFAAAPNVADMVQQLDHSAASLIAGAAIPDIIHDRCPLDLIAYIEVLAAVAGEEWIPSGRQLAQIGKAIAGLDLIVFLPLGAPEDIRTKIELPRLRRQVDLRLKRLIADDELGLFPADLQIAALSGTPSTRLKELERRVFPHRDA